MPRKGFSEEQIAFALRQAESGTPVGVNGGLIPGQCGGVKAGQWG
jgi:hypothetical protein